MSTAARFENHSSARGCGGCGGCGQSSQWETQSKRLNRAFLKEI